MKIMFRTFILQSILFFLTSTLSAHESESIENSAELILGEDQCIAIYFENFERLKKTEDWNQIIALGKEALKSLQKLGRKNEEAIICAQLASTFFYKGDYISSLECASRCHELAEHFTDASLYVRALYLESAIFRALAGKDSGSESQILFKNAVETAEEALNVYAKNNLDNPDLLGKVFFNLGAAHADNSQGNLKVASQCYIQALELFEKSNNVDDIIRTTIRLAKICLLQENYAAVELMISQVRPKIPSERLMIQLEYLDAQLKLAINRPEEALQIALHALGRAVHLEAKEDERRLLALIEKIQSKSLL